MYRYRHVSLLCLATLLVSTSLIFILVQPSVAYRLPDSNHERFTLDFLANVTGFSDFRIISFNNSTSRMIGSQQEYTCIGTLIGMYNQSFKVKLTLVNNSFSRYDLDLPSDFPFEEKTVNDCLVVANRTIEKYRRFFNADHCDGYSEMISLAISNESLIVENDDVVMKISYQETLSTHRDFEEYVLVEWLPKFRNQTPTRHLATYVSVSKYGLVTSIVDNSAVNYIAAMDNTSMEEAIETAAPYAQTYAEEHGQEIVSVEATLVLTPDLDHRRGDDESALYPIWDVKVAYNETNEEGVTYYGVAVWADTGEVRKHQPIYRGTLLPPSQYDIGSLVLLAAIAVSAVFLLLSGFKLYRRRDVQIKVGVKR